MKRVKPIFPQHHIQTECQRYGHDSRALAQHFSDQVWGPVTRRVKWPVEDQLHDDLQREGYE